MTKAPRPKTGAVAWDDVRYVLAIDRARSVSGAADELGVDAATVSRRVARIEELHGAKLFDRSSTGVTPTSAGERLLVLAREAEEKMLEVEWHVRGLAPRQGHVRLATTHILATGFLAPRLPTFAASQPRITVQLSVSRAVADLARAQADIALRMKSGSPPPAEPSVTTTTLATVGWAAYAPLVGAIDSAVRYNGPVQPGAAWLEVNVGPHSVTLADDVPTACALVRAGAGVAVVPCFYADIYPGIRRVSKVLDEHRLFLATPARTKKTPRVRAVVEWLRAEVDAARSQFSGA